MQKVAENINAKYGEGTVQVDITDSYFNMLEQIKPHFHLVTYAKEAIKRVGLVPVECPIRGGTDGAQLSFKGLPCPNIFAGGLNFHGRYEFIPVQSMEKAVETVINIIKLVK